MSLFLKTKHRYARVIASGLLAVVLGHSILAYGAEQFSSQISWRGSTEIGSQTPNKNNARTTILVPLPNKSCWQDMAFLAAIPAASVVNKGTPSLIVLEASGEITPEVQDYLRRYEPNSLFIIGIDGDGRKIANRTSNLLKADSADAAACVLSAKFWKTAATAVVCAEDDYEAALIAAPLAAHLSSPLFFVGAQGLSSTASAEIRRLATKELIIVGKISGEHDSLKKVVPRMTELVTAHEVMSWAQNKKLKIDYLAAVNPLDRTKTVIKKLSLAGAMLAAGRNGLVTPLSFDVSWKIPFSGTGASKAPADPKQPDTQPKSGKITLEGKEFAFTVNYERKASVVIDVNGDGKFAGANEGPFGTGDTVDLVGKRYAIALGDDTGPGKADVRLTWPTAEEVAAHLNMEYRKVGIIPEYVCLVGFPDAIPQAIFDSNAVVKEVTSDLVYANVDDDPFAEICVARVIAENTSFGTLYASRALTYEDLLDPELKKRACEACWENSTSKRFQNVGFDSNYRHTEDDLKWIKPPVNGKGGRREHTFEQDSPLAHCLVLSHESHSSWQQLGEMFNWNASVLLAPVVIESGGCATAALDQESDYHSVVARLFRNGAVAFSGNSRLGIAEGQMLRHEFWNGMLNGETTGQAHRRAINSMQMTVLDKKGGAAKYLYQLRIRTQFGDPALTLPLPNKPRSKPAYCTLANTKLTIFAPAEWWPIKMHVPADWKEWADKDLFVLRGAGAYSHCSWGKDKFNQEEVYMTAEFMSKRPVAKIEQVSKIPAPLGWNGTYYTDKNEDGSYTYRFAVRLADFDQIKGKMINKADRLEYKITYQ